MAYKFQTLAATMSGSLTQEGDFTVKNDAGTTAFTATDAGAVSGSGALSAGGNLQTAGTVKFTGVADTAVAVSADSMFFLDADGLMKSERLTDYATAIAGDGLAAASGVLAVGVDDSSIELNSDALRVKAQGITNSMLADDAVGADELAANAVVEASIVDNAVTLAKMAGITRGSIILGDSSGDPSYLAKGTAAQFLQSDGTDPSYVTISGDATVAAGGALTIAANAVQDSMVNDDVATGLAGVGLSAASGVMALDLNELTAETIASGDFLSFVDSTDNGTHKESIDDIATLFAGDGLSASSAVLAVAVSGAVHVSSDKVSISGSIAGPGLGYVGGVDSILGLELDIDELSALGGTGVAQGDHFVFSDAGIEKKITFSNMEDAIFGNVSGDATIAAGGALTIAADAVEPSMMNIFDDSLAATTTHFLIADGTDYSSFALSGDVTCTNAGVVTIANDAVETAMLNDNIISGQTELAHADIADADEFMISDGGTLKRVGVDSLRDHYFGVVSGDATIADGGALTIAANAVEDSMVNDNVATGLAGVGLIASSGVLAIELNECNSAAVSVANDSIAIIDADDSNLTKKESIADLVAGMAGAGLSAASGQLSVTGNNVSLKADGNALVEGYNYFADASSNATVTMPASPAVGDVVVAKAGNLTSNAVITINKGSADHRIDGLEGIVLESPFAAVTMVYVVADHWKIV